jgi:hypothetical protein
MPSGYPFVPCIAFCAGNRDCILDGAVDHELCICEDPECECHDYEPIDREPVDPFKGIQMLRMTFADKSYTKIDETEVIVGEGNMFRLEDISDIDAAEKVIIYGYDKYGVPLVRIVD